MGFERGWRLEESSPYEEARRLDSRFRGNDRRALRTPYLGGGYILRDKPLIVRGRLGWEKISTRWGGGVTMN